MHNDVAKLVVRVPKSTTFTCMSNTLFSNLESFDSQLLQVTDSVLIVLTHNVNLPLLPLKNVELL